MKIPWNIEDAKQLGIVLNRYKGDHYYHVMAGVFLTYILYPFVICKQICNVFIIFSLIYIIVYKRLPFLDHYFYQYYLDIYSPFMSL